jgi:hypothetical protein
MSEKGQMCLGTLEGDEGRLLLCKAYIGYGTRDRGLRSVPVWIEQNETVAEMSGRCRIVHPIAFESS